METIPKSECEKIGYFKKTHGVRGELVLEFEPQFEFSIENANRFFVEIDGLLVPFFLVEDGFRYKTDDTAILTFNGVETEKYAKRLVGCSVFLFTDEIQPEPDAEADDRFQGFTLWDATLGEIGKIEHIDDYSGNIVFTVNYGGTELLVPFNEDFLVETDAQRKIIKLRLPEGLIE